MTISNGDPLKIFVPFVNEKMTTELFSENKFLLNMDIHLFDNRVRSAGLPKLYNEIIENHLNEDAWLFFVHEDFEIQGEFFDTENLAHEAVYGTFGVRLDGHAPVAFGQHKCSEKDGSSVLQVGVPVTSPTWVETLDCVAILIHTRLLRDRPRLRFDEVLTFDLYAEDFCINAQENFGVPVMVLPVEFQHYSKGYVTERYWRGIKHLGEKYPNVGVPGSCSFIGGKSQELETHYTYDIPANRQKRRDRAAKKNRNYFKALRLFRKRP
ncbi:hypothetical protein [Ruegeria atlantica]|uniref:Uncharacterized protein n=1 Tax=Ruegeria atlantica TaxID=81569 RepID=A0A0P1EMJ0_9RHOB|nr:hypothetical protein [Ruegeria atlantica]CUH42685.1 hypothetical protein RUM4293_01574 [Ruegeria atlantica]